MITQPTVSLLLFTDECADHLYFSCTRRLRMKKMALMATGPMKRNLGFEYKEEEKWVKYYSSSHQILLVGDGDFSFSLCLGRGFGSASNIVASSLDSYDEVLKKYRDGKSNLDKLKELGACLLHEVDVAYMKHHPHLKMRKFDRIIFNFPHAGFHGKEDDSHMILKHRELVLKFFENAGCLLRTYGEIHVNHKNKLPYRNWNIEELASQSSLTLLDCVDFKQKDYPGYNNKRGDGSRCDDDFHLGRSSTYKFVHDYRAKKRSMKINHTDSIQQRNPPFPAIKVAEEQNHALIMSEALRLELGSRNENFPIIGDYSRNVADILGSVAAPDTGFSAHDMRLDLQRPWQPLPASINLQYPQIDHIGKMGVMHLSPGARNEPYHVIGSSSSYLEEVLGRRAEMKACSLLGARPSFERSIAELPGRTLNGDIYVEHKLHHVCILNLGMRRILPDCEMNCSAVKLQL